MVLLWVKYILCGSGCRTPKTSKIEFFLKLVYSLTKSFILDHVRSCTRCVSAMNNGSYCHTCNIQYTIRALNNNHSFGSIHCTHMLCNTHVACLTNIYLETEQNLFVPICTNIHQLTQCYQSKRWLTKTWSSANREGDYAVNLMLEMVQEVTCPSMYASIIYRKHMELFKDLY